MTRNSEKKKPAIAAPTDLVKKLGSPMLAFMPSRASMAPVLIAAAAKQAPTGPRSVVAKKHATAAMVESVHSAMARSASSCDYVVRQRAWNDRPRT